MHRRWSRRGAALLVAVLIGAAACGDDDDPGVSATGSDTASEEAAFPVTVEAANGEVRIESRPERIVSLSPTATEMLFAIGAGDQVVAVDELSNYPDGAPVTELTGFEPNVEAIAGYTPDLVVVSDDLNSVIAGLDAIAIPVLQVPSAATLDDAYAEIEQLGAATGHVGDAAEVVGTMQTDIDRLVAEIPGSSEPLTYYHELDQTFFSVTSSTFIGEIYSLVGLTNIADAAEAASGGYPQLSAEFIVDADPDLIFLADTKCCGVTAASVGDRPGWNQLTAVQTGGVIELDDDIASRWGPRVVDFLATIVDAVAALEPAGN
ncbi:MAG: ABC transporter substrate-binding protein [Acidimicrobiales bacterium]